MKTKDHLVISREILEEVDEIAGKSFKGSGSWELWKKPKGLGAIRTTLD